MRGQSLERRNDIAISANSMWNLVNFRGGLIRALSTRGFHVTAISPRDEVAGRPAPACDHVAIDIDRSGVNPLRDLKLLWSYYRTLRRLRPAAYLSFTVKPNIYGALAARWAGVPSLPNVSGLGTAFIRGNGLARFVGHLYRLAFCRSAVVFFQNPDDRDLFVKRRMVRAGQARLLPGSGIDLGHFTPGPKPGPGTPTFLFIGRLLGDKGVREFAQAAQIVKREMPDARFQLLGAIDEGNRTAIGRPELDDWVGRGLIEYLGQQRDVRPYIRAAMAVVLPSYREGLPRTLLEAAAMARPLVASDVPGNRELVVDGVTGLLCEARSASSLSQALLRMARMSAGRRSEMGRAARERVEHNFGESIVIQAYLDALQQLSGCRGS